MVGDAPNYSHSNYFIRFTEYVKFLRGDYLKEEKPKAKDASATKAGAKPRDIRRLTAAKINSGTGYDDKTPMVKQQTVRNAKVSLLMNICAESVMEYLHKEYH